MYEVNSQASYAVHCGESRTIAAVTGSDHKPPI